MPENQESVYDQVEKKASTIEGMTQLVSQASQWFEKPTELTEDMRERVFAILRLSMDYLRKVPRNEDNVMLEVVGWDESREIAAGPKDKSGNIKYLAPISGTSKMFMDIRTPEGLTFRIPIEESIGEAIYRCQKIPEGADALEKLVAEAR